LKNTGKRKVVLVVLLFFAFLMFGCMVLAYADSVPEWDGVYVKDSDGHYTELRVVIKVQIVTYQNGSRTYWTSDFTIIPPSKFKEILIKGKTLNDGATFQHVGREKNSSLKSLLSPSAPPQWFDAFFLDHRTRNYDLRTRQEGGDGRYYEPREEAIQYFGSADKGDFVLLLLGNDTGYIFGIGQ
jgi:hypothetical protein